MGRDPTEQNLEARGSCAHGCADSLQRLTLLCFSHRMCLTLTKLAGLSFLSVALQSGAQSV